MATGRTFWQRLKAVGAVLAALVTALAAMSQFAGVSLKDVYQAIVPPKKEGCVIVDYRRKNAIFAKASINNMGLIPVIQNVKEDAFEIGTVISQFPEAGTIMNECKGQVVLQVSADAQTVAETPEVYPATPSKLNGEGSQINVGRIFAISAIIIFVFYFLYRATDFF